MFFVLDLYAEFEEVDIPQYFCHLSEFVLILQ